MVEFVGLLRDSYFSPQTLIGAVVLALLFLIVAMTLAALVRRGVRGARTHLSDVTGLAFASALGQVGVYLVAFILYAHLIPALRAFGTALLAGASVISVVFAVAAQNTLSNVVAGFSLVMYRPIRVGEQVRLSTPKGLISARVEAISLGYTILVDGDGDQLYVPNSVMMNTIVIRKPGDRGPSSVEGG
jgi:small-conductance mechanosensitive channel